MVAIGYSLLGEEHEAPDLVRHAVRAEAAGFTFATASDHFHPWLDAQGHSPFVWSVLGALAQATDRLVLGTAVTCPTVRIHPAVIAQAAATTATLAPGRFFLGVGSGEALNEHILGDPWPRPAVRLEMLREAIDIMRALWRGKEWSHDGAFFNVHRARLYSLPDSPPPVLVAISGPTSAGVAADVGDGLVGLAPDAALIEEWRARGGAGPRLAQFSVAYAATPEAGRELVHKYWRQGQLPFGMHSELFTPKEFEGASSFIRPEDIDAKKKPMGPDPRPVIETIERYAAAGYDHIALHQIGPDQEAFLDWFRREVAPAIESGPPTLTAAPTGSDSAADARPRDRVLPHG